MAALCPYIVGNWKMHGLQNSLEQVQAIAAHAEKLTDIESALCIPATLIAHHASAIPDFVFGAQDCHDQPSGAYTGSISAPMLRDAGAQLTIVGHSERRDGFAESDALVQAKAVSALAAGLGVILCVGESRQTRDAGQAEAYVLAQLAESVPDLANDMLTSGRFSIAYEPIWAIGTGLIPTVANVQAMHAAIRAALVARFGAAGNHIRILYGGSVNGDNAAELLAIDYVNGALVGGASLTAEKFIPILTEAANIAA
jgi:triosephosphate isomerase (TIM)